MSSPKHFNTAAGAVPYKGLFSTVSVAPAGCSLAFISSQWACDRETQGVVPGAENDYAKQSEIVWGNIVAILKELGVGLDAVLHKTATFADFDEKIGEQAVTAMMGVLPDEWKPHAMSSALSFQKAPAGYHLPGLVYIVDLIVAVPAHK